MGKLYSLSKEAKFSISYRKVNVIDFKRFRCQLFTKNGKESQNIKGKFKENHIRTLTK